MIHRLCPSERHQRLHLTLSFAILHGFLCRISSLDPVWEAGYERQFFDFSGGDGDLFSAFDDDTINSEP